jgi:hypothetical protein
MHGRSAAKAPDQTTNTQHARISEIISIQGGSKGT